MTAVKHECKHEKELYWSKAVGGAGFGAEHEVPCARRRFEADRAYGAVWIRIICNIG